jgi:hypothetical protein
MPGLDPSTQIVVNTGGNNVWNWTTMGAYVDNIFANTPSSSITQIDNATEQIVTSGLDTILGTDQSGGITYSAITAVNKINTSALTNPQMLYFRTTDGPYVTMMADELICTRINNWINSQPASAYSIGDWLMIGGTNYILTGSAPHYVVRCIYYQPTNGPVPNIDTINWGPLILTLNQVGNFLQIVQSDPVDYDQGDVPIFNEVIGESSQYYQISSITTAAMPSFAYQLVTANNVYQILAGFSIGTPPPGATYDASGTVVPKSGEVKPNEVKPNEVKPSEVKPSEVKPKPSQYKPLPSGIKPSDVKPVKPTESSK